MESLEVLVDDDWNNLSRIFSSVEDRYSIDQLHGHGHGMFPINIETPSTFWSTDHESSNASAPMFMFNEGLFLNDYPVSQETRNSSGTSATINLSLPTLSYENYHNYSEQSSMDICGMDYENNNFLSHVFSDDVMEDILCLKQAVRNNLGDQHMSDQQSREINLPLKRNFEIPESPQAPKDEFVKIDQFDKNPKKKQRVSRRNNKNKKSMQSKKNQETSTDTNGNDGELKTINNGGNINGQSLTSYCSEDDSNSNPNGSQESNGEGTLNLNGNTRASRGAATDPQSLYARKRRERINERLRILQNLVPNGTKVDTCTMLEEAVHYVKFLQLQIKLLNSDDMWMYAPIVYNGMDMGLYKKITSLVQ